MEGATFHDRRYQWYHVVNGLIVRLLTNEVLREAHNKVVPVEQSDREDQDMFAERISKAARMCQHVLGNDDRNSFFTQGFRTAVR